MEDVRSPVWNGHHLIIWLISHNVIDKVQTCGWTAQGKRKVVLVCVSFDQEYFPSYWNLNDVFYSQLCQQGILEQRLFVAWQEQAFVRAEVLNECVCRVPILKKYMNTIMHSFPLWCVSCYASSILTYRLNDGILDLSVAVLLHPGLPDNHSSSLLCCLKVENC